MNEKLRKGATHISDTDVDEMIAAMGRPEDFDKEASGEENASANEGNTGSAQNDRRRLYRDESNKVLGGVCSGIANWLNIDPTVVRILFAVIAFGGFGSGILVYILLWIFLPTKNLTAYKGKRMFRNPDDKVIGGVAGGMGAYFNINSSTIRWILAIPLILSVLKGMHFFGWNDDFNIFPNLFFGGITGTFIFIYIVLWIVLPEANSPYEKMEMYGKTVDVNSIKENVQGSMNDMKGRLQNWSE
ncbi:MAG TPA: PspC domain-containing protein, partial [Niabella sp.]|nr:PspC domain-containing protein [Niabella sp.]